MKMTDLELLRKLEAEYGITILGRLIKADFEDYLAVDCAEYDVDRDEAIANRAEWIQDVLQGDE